jgi:hypothetical protein
MMLEPNPLTTLPQYTDGELAELNHDFENLPAATLGAVVIDPLRRRFPSRLRFPSPSLAPSWPPATAGDPETRADAAPRKCRRRDLNPRETT